MTLISRVLESLLFASDKPVSVVECVKYLRGAADANLENEGAVALGKMKPEEIEEVLRGLQDEYEEEDRGFRVVESAAGWKVVTTPTSAPWVRQLFPENRPTRLSPSALETLAIIAYRQLIHRADIEAVRGVSVDGVMQTLLERGLIRIAGRAELPGRPLLYGTTEFFLEHFGLRTLDELPNCAELRRVELPSAKKGEEQGTLPLEEPAAEAEQEAGKTDAPEEVGSDEATEVTVAGAVEAPTETPAETSDASEEGQENIEDKREMEAE